MLRTSLLSSRLGISARAGRQLSANGALLRRSFADKPTINDSKPVVLPGSASSSTDEPLPPGAVRTSESSTVTETPATPATPSTPTIPSDNIPRAPAGPTVSQTTPTTPGAPPQPHASSTPPPPPPKKQGKSVRRFLTSLIILTALGFGGGVYYARINDTFHDFFTEYVPYGEEAVLYLEELEFRKRFPQIAARGPKPRDTGSKVTIPIQAGVSSKEVEKETPKAKPSADLKDRLSETPEEHLAVVKEAKKEPVPVKPVEKKPEPKPEVKQPTETAAPQPKKRAPQVNEPSVFPTEIAPIAPINLQVPDPIVQDLTKILNNIISVINEDASNLNEDVKYTTTMEKSKNEIAKVAERIMSLKQEAEKLADQKIQGIHREFDQAAQGLVQKLQGEMQDHEMRWKSEFESERQKIQEAYENKLKIETERQEEVNEKKLENQLLQQALSMQKYFTSEVKSQVEQEREGRLGKLSELKNEILELEKLTAEWNKVVEANLKTQHLHVAVEAVRAKLEESPTIPTPFVRELAALKEIADGDAVVDAAISSINPVAYQKGIPSSAMLIDRFRRVAGEVRKASLLPDEAGVASHVGSWALSKVMFKKVGSGLPEGDDVESVLARTEMLLEEGNLDDAAREMASLKGWAGRLSSDWLAECRKVLEVRQALDVIAAEARLESLRVD